MVELPEELRMFQLTVRRYVRDELMPLEAYVLREEEIPQTERDRVEALGRELGLWKAGLSEDLGGAGFGLMGMMIVSEEMSKVLPIIGGNLYSSGPPPLQRSPEQMERWFWPVLNGEKTWCFALTEEGGGSDPAGNMQTTAARDGDNWVINGRKVFVTAGDTADFAVVFALTDKEKRGRGGINAFVVEKGTQGVTVERRIETLGEVTPVVMAFDNVVVPDFNRVGGEGSGYGTAQRALTAARVQIGARAIGMSERLLEMGIEYGKNRITFGEPIGDRQGVQFMLADCAIEIHACRSMTYDVAWKADHGQDPRIWASIVKVYASEIVWNVADRILQIHGGWGYSRELPIERFLRIARLWRIAEGPNEVHRWIIGRTLQKYGIGLLRPVN
jgi:alkylation response protein AidB-like acyl-CoA dehydrogenase